MPYDSNLPANGTKATAAQMRGQLQGLKALIDAIVTIVAAQIAGVSTLPPGEAAAATVSVAGDTLHFSFAIPRGNDGAQGDPGPIGAQGPPFAQAIVDAVNTLAPGSNATVGVSFDGTHVHLTFGIPRGADGEVTNAALDAAIAGTSANSNGVATLGIAVSDPPTQAQMQAIADKQDELILALRRP